MGKIGRFSLFPAGFLKASFHEKEALEYRFTAAQAIIQLYLTSAALKESLGSLPLHIIFSDSHRCVCRCVVYLLLLI